MKKLLTSLCLLALVLVCVFAEPSKAEAAAAAKGCCGKNLAWAFDGKNTLTISGKGAMDDYADATEAPWYSVFCLVEKLVIKSGVTTIGDNAFFAGVKLVDVQIPNSVTKIGAGAFSASPCFTEFTVPAGVKTIGPYAFGNCLGMQKFKVASGNTAFSVDSKGVLYNKDKTVLVQAPTLISGTITIPSSVKTITARAFEDCTALQKVQGMAGITAIGHSAFRSCQSLQSFQVPKGVKKLDTLTFSDCGSLKTVTIPASTTEICRDAFEYCKSLEKITVASGNPKYFSDSRGVVFAENKQVLFVAPGAISGSYTIPSTVKAIGEAAFSFCSKLEKLTIPDSVEAIGKWAFNSCQSLKELYIPASVTNWGNGALDNCYKLEKLTVDENNTVLSSDEWGVLFTKNKDILIQAPAGIKCKTYCVPNTVQFVQSYAFWCTSLEGVYVPNGVTYLGNGAFMGCSKLTFVSLPASLNFIDAETFLGCHALKDIYYHGTKAQWEAMPKYDLSEPLKKAKVHYNTIGAKLTITAQPKSVVADKGGVAKVTVKATGCGLSYTWYHKSAAATKYKKASVTGATYSVKMSDSVNGRYVYCVITDMFGNSVKTGVVRVKMGNLAKILTQPVNVTVPKGKTAKVTLKATGDGLKYTWYYAKKGATKYTKSSVTASALSVKMASTWNGAKVYCVIKDQYGNSVKSSVVKLHMGNPAKITTQPKTAVVSKNKTAKLTVKATGDGLKYTWYYAKKGATKYTKSSVTKNVFSVKMTSKWNYTKAYCVVTDKHGNTVKTEVVRLFMGKPAKITTQPKSVTVKNGKTAKVTIKAVGDGLKYTWYYLKPGATKYAKSSITKNVFSVKMAAAWKNAKVYCVISDKYGNTVKSKVVSLKMK